MRVNRIIQEVIGKKRRNLARRAEIHVCGGISDMPLGGKGAMSGKTNMKTAWLASQLLDGVSKGDVRRVRSTGRVIGHLANRLHRFDPSTQERVELLGAISSSAQTGETPPAHYELLRHLARTLLVQSVHGPT